MSDLWDDADIEDDDIFIRFARWSDIDVLITNSEADPAIVRTIEAAGTTVLLA